MTEALTDGQRGTVLVEETPFYGTMGGQQADVGTIFVRQAVFRWRTPYTFRAARWAM